MAPHPKLIVPSYGPKTSTKFQTLPLALSNIHPLKNLIYKPRPYITKRKLYKISDGIVQTITVHMYKANNGSANEKSPRTKNVNIQNSKAE